MSVKYHDAIFSIYGADALFYIQENDYDQLKWDENNEAPKPSKAELDAEVDRLTAEIPGREARAQRDRLLTESDWVTIRATDTGSPVPTEWQTYRQALRDITAQAGFPDTIDWPVKPEE